MNSGFLFTQWIKIFYYNHYFNAYVGKDLCSDSSLRLALSL